ncbi:MAG: DUF4123 domain-containing protein [Acidobacteriia bacterium]|nr:DUF4123 domain-containing protein [Terriglobia bacterium]
MNIASSNERARAAQRLHEEIFQDGAQTFAVLDGASAPGLLDRLEQWKPEFICLYRGELKPDLAQVAPYLIRLEPETELTAWILSKGWGNHWGIFAIANADLRTMRQHFRRLLTVYDENGKPLLFRFYDPRVLRTYLPTCNANERATFFGPIREYLLEAEQPAEVVSYKAPAISSV